MNTNPALLSPLHLDALRELCNLCAGKAADALSRLLGDARVGLELPEAERLAIPRVVERLGGGTSKLVASRVELAGPVQGDLWLTLPESDAIQLSGLLEHGAEGVAPWALYETANIVASACLNALYAVTNLTVIPGVPEVVHATAEEVGARISRSRPGRDEIFLLTTELLLRDAPVRARILVVPREDSLQRLLAAMGLGAGR